MKKITLITRNFPPLTGGMERFIFNVYRLLQKDYDCTIIGPEGCRNFISSKSTVVQIKIRPTILFIWSSFLNGFMHFLKKKPDIIMGGSGLVAPIVIILSKLFAAKSVIFLYGLDIIVESRIYKTLFLPFLKHASQIIAISKNTARLALEIGIPPDMIKIINPGVELPLNPVSQDKAKKLLHLSNKKILLSVGRLVPRKGLVEFINKTLPDMVNINPSILFLIVGSEGNQALNRNNVSVRKKIKESIDHHHLNHNVQLIGYVTDEQLALLYACADVFVFPLIETPGDVEGFGMVVIEASAFGTPAVTFDCGGVSDAVQSGCNGYLIPPGDYDEFGKKILTLLDTNNNHMRTTARAFAKTFSWSSFHKKLKYSLDQLF